MHLQNVSNVFQRSSSTPSAKYRETRYSVPQSNSFHNSSFHLPVSRMFGCGVQGNKQSIRCWKVDSEQNRWRGRNCNLQSYGTKVCAYANRCGSSEVYRTLAQGHKGNSWHCGMHRWFSYPYYATMCQRQWIFQSQRLLQLEYSRYCTFVHAC